MVCCWSPLAVAGRSLEVPVLFQQGLEQIRDGQLEQALDTSEALRNAFPEQPFAFLVAMEAYWWMIYCETGQITSRHLWYLAEKKTSFYDKQFFEAADRALQFSSAMRLQPESAAAGALYAGLVRGAQARLYAVREQSTQSASEAKRMRADLLDAIAKDPQLAPEAYIGLGTYNYYADALSPILKLLRFFFRFPGGSREKGLQQLRAASKESGLWSEEAKYELARIYGVREGRHREALLLSKELAARHPDNPFYALSATYEAEQAGQRGTAVEYCRKAVQAAEKMQGGCGHRLREVALQALERLQQKDRTPQD